MAEDRYAYSRRKAAERAGTGGGDDLRAAATVEAADIGANASMTNQEQAVGTVRGSGTLTHYRPTGGWRTPGPGAGTPSEDSPGNLRATAEAAELGAPTSFNSGAGAPESIGVIRGTRQTFAPQRQEGKQFIEGEYSTPLRAAQAYNRALGPDAGGGEFEPVEGPKLRLAADLDKKNPDKAAQADIIKQTQFGKLLNDRLLKDYGVSVKGEDGQESLVLPSGIKRLALGHSPGSAEDVEAIMQKIAPEGTKIKSATSWNDPKTGMAMRRQLLDTTTDPAEQKRIKEEMVTPENLAWFEGRRTQPGAPPAKSSLRQPEADGMASGILDRTALLGKTLSYEMQPSLRKAGTPAPTLESVRNERLTNRQRIWDEENLRAGAPRAM